MKSLSSLVTVSLLSISVAPAAIIDLNSNTQGILVDVITSPTGSGNFGSFLRIQSNQSPQSGYNTDGAFEFDTKAGTHALALSSVPIVTFNGLTYREFVLDVNETNSTQALTLTDLEVYMTSNVNLTGYSFGLTPVFDFSGAASVADGPGGSGKGDYKVLILDSLLTGGTNVVIYASFRGNDGGFEEFGVLDGAQNQVPEPSSLALIGSALIGCAFLRRRKQ